MIIATDIELRAGSRLLIESASFRVNPGDKIGLVGRNGAGKTTLTKVLAGEALPAAGTVTTAGAVGYLPQDPRTGDLEVLARDRILSARGLDEVLRELRAAELGMSSADERTREKAVRQYGRLEDQMHVLGGYAAESEAASIASSLGLAGPGPGAAAENAFWRPAQAGRIGAHSFQRSGNSPSGRADKPPRC